LLAGLKPRDRLGLERGLAGLEATLGLERE